MATETCKLCLKNDQLRNSHIIPLFVVDYIKRTSSSGYLRRAINPNLRIQDFPKLKLLCENCEQLFSEREKIFCEKIFIPYLEKGIKKFKYAEWLQYFAVSLAWRTAIVGKTAHIKIHPHQSQKIDKLIQDWANYLLGNTIAPISENHIFSWISSPKLLTIFP